MARVLPVLLAMGMGMNGAMGLDAAAALLAEPSAVLSLGDPATGAQWEGLADGGRLSVPGTATFSAPRGEKGWTNHGFYAYYDGAVDALATVAGGGVRLTLEKPDARALRVRVTVRAPKSVARQEFLEDVSAEAVVDGDGARVVWLPWTAFNFPLTQAAFLQFIIGVDVHAEYMDREQGGATLRACAFTHGPALALWTPVAGRAVSGADAGELSYDMLVLNADDAPRTATLTLQQPGWHAGAARVEPAVVSVPAGGVTTARVTISVPTRVPPGGRETWRLVARSGADAAVELPLVAARDVAHPYLLHTAARWDEVRAKVEAHAWAREGADAYIDRATRWVVPAARPASANPADAHNDWLFATRIEDDVTAAAVAWQLTRDPAHAAKVADFWRKFSDPATGYPRTLRGCHQELVQEGHFFFNLVKAYDMTRDAQDAYTDEDHANIARTLRLFATFIGRVMHKGNISNWDVAELSGALSASLMLGDWALASRLYEGPCGVVDQFGKGIMNDGWWYECSTSYNIWMANLGLEFHGMLAPWGENFRDREIPAGFAPNQSLIPWAMRSGLLGMAFEKWGPVTRPTVRIRDMLDGVIPHVDWRGIIYAANDSDEKEVNGNLFERAYYWYREPAYAAMVRFSKSRDLLWGVPDLPDTAPPAHLATVKADNAGMAVLRSQTPGRPARDRLQAVLKYGSHGGFHGHFDRASLLSVFRHGKSFFCPEMVWYSYGSIMYKFYVQTSISKNMTVVDLKQQEPVDSRNLLFHAGEAMQASVVETNARWTYPPYAGGWVTDDYEDLLYQQAKYLPLPDPMPDVLAATDPTERVLQRRALIVLDDCLIVADHLKSETGTERTFDHLWQIKGLRALEAPVKQDTGTRPQLDKDILNSAQLVTDIHSYRTEGTTTARFTMDFTPGGTGPDIDRGSGFFPRNEPGILHMNVHNAWPPKRDVWTGYPPESIRDMGKRLRYRVSADGETLAEGRFGAWAVGKKEIDLDLAGRKTLTLETWTDSGRAARNQLLWASARWVDSDGRERVAALEQWDNVRPLSAPDADYEGGPIRIEGAQHDSALPAQPDNPDKPATLSFNLDDAKRARFRATLGADFPVGPDTWRRRTLSFRTVGQEAHFLTVVEPFETDAPMVVAAESDAPGRVRIRYTDGRAHEVAVQGLDGEDAAKLVVTLREFDADGLEVRTERTR